jgi:hypothetical protein
MQDGPLPLLGNSSSRHSKQAASQATTSSSHSKHAPSSSNRGPSQARSGRQLLLPQLLQANRVRLAQQLQGLQAVAGEVHHLQAHQAPPRSAQAASSSHIRPMARSRKQV